MFSNKSKVKKLCKANGHQLFELHDSTGYMVKVLTKDGDYIYETEALYKNIAYERVLKLMAPRDGWKQIV